MMPGLFFALALVGVVAVIAGALMSEMANKKLDLNRGQIAIALMLVIAFLGFMTGATLPLGKP